MASGGNVVVGTMVHSTGRPLLSMKTSRQEQGITEHTASGWSGQVALAQADSDTRHVLEGSVGHTTLSARFTNRNVFQPYLIDPSRH